MGNKRETYEVNYISDSIIIEDSYADVLQNNNGQNSKINVVTLPLPTNLSSYLDLTTLESDIDYPSTTQGVGEIVSKLIEVENDNIMDQNLVEKTTVIMATVNIESPPADFTYYPEMPQSSATINNENLGVSYDYDPNLGSTNGNVTVNDITTEKNSSLL